ncbi:MAG: hypothetical protein WC677_08760 [Clostridia bacterium]|jgi:bifunctional DNA-binding transcriptional regulator/antitoxin component of YhaV-PrlF toxin-antitoxin module
MPIETPETRQKLSNAIRELEAKGDITTINQLVSAYKAKYRSTPTPQPQKSLTDKLKKVNPMDVAGKTAGFYKDALIGGAKGVASTAQGMSILGQKILQGTVGKVMGQQGKPAAKIFSDKQLTPTNAIQSGGKMGEQVAEFFVPSGAANKLARGVGVVKKTLIRSAETALPTALQTGGNVEQTKNAALLGGGMSLLGSAYRAIKPLASDAQKINKLAGTIIQGKTKDITTAKKALSDIDISGVKTYTDLTKATNRKIESLAGGLDEILAKNKTTKKLSDLGLSMKTGSETLTHNYVDDAIKQLDDLYIKTNDIGKRAVLKQLKNKAQTNGLTIQEINNLAKLHGQDLNAFNANGEAASGLAKQAAENTRKGLKSTARGLFKNPVYEATDEQMTNLIRLRDLSKKMEEKVNTLRQTTIPRGFIEKTSGNIADTLDRMTGRSVSGSVRKVLIPRGGGLKTMNALDVEEALQKNLKEVRGLLKSNELKAFDEIFKDIIFNYKKSLKYVTPKAINKKSVSGFLINKDRKENQY